MISFVSTFVTYETIDFDHTQDNNRVPCCGVMHKMPPIILNIYNPGEDTIVTTFLTLGIRGQSWRSKKYLWTQPASTPCAQGWLSWQISF